MKKVLFTIVIIAILVGTALITMAPQPSPPTNLSTLNSKLDILTNKIDTLTTNVGAINDEVTAIEDDVSNIIDDLGNVTKMETVYASYEVLYFSGTDRVYEVQYNEPRHVSLTLQWDGLEIPITEGIAVAAWVTGTPSWEESIVYICRPDYAAHGIETVEFNADHWYISVRNDGVWSGDMYYAATVTYPLQP